MFMVADYSQHVYYMNTDTRNKINNGVQLIVDKFACDVDNFHYIKLYQTIEKLYKEGARSLYEVGFGFGQHMINIKKLCPEMRIGGCELSVEYMIYANNYFNLGDYDFKFDIGNIIDLEPPKEKYDIVLCDGLLGSFSTELDRNQFEQTIVKWGHQIVSLDGKYQGSDLLIADKDKGYVIFGSLPKPSDGDERPIEAYITVLTVQLDKFIMPKPEELVVYENPKAIVDNYKILQKDRVEKITKESPFSSKDIEELEQKRKETGDDSIGRPTRPRRILPGPILQVGFPSIDAKNIPKEKND